ncbi:glycoside hydrolase family 38 C-terminal domain-containing protein [Gottfriedia acidiceleris]|uniref:glycoside hydrolase family 38 N-terminal domain-containing protein n=1 Tax=Gottfriedia acidiceleris TaxID=371036 RepID=UPI002F2609D5
MDNIKEVHILNHTHWDREWYESFEEFRYKLRNGIRYVQELLTSGKIDNFFFDGQTIVIDDYKEVVSKEEYERFVSFILHGKIEVGPWYLLADEFLVSGESMIKNLEIGIKMAKSFGSSHNIGYLPDTFGHVSQIPQILKGFHIDNALLFRGAISEQFENIWEGADGSRVFTFVLPLFEGYYQTFLKHNTYQEETRKYLESSAPFLSYGKALIMNGADHTFTSSDVNHKIEQLKMNFPKIEFKQSLMSQYIEAFEGKEALRTIKGEQRNPSKIFILPGVLSTRTYLKNKNQQCEDLAIGVMEALNVWTNGSTDSKKFIEYVWKLLLKNQPHDSICGCSIDEVHKEMETRSQKVISAISQFAKDILNDQFPFEFLDSSKNNTYLYLINNTPFLDVYPVEATIFIPVDEDLGAITLYYEDKPIPFDVVSREKSEEFLRHILAEPHYTEYVIYHVKFTMAFDGVEIKKVRIERLQEAKAFELPSEQNLIENEFYEITWNDQGLQILDKERNITYKNQHQFFSSLDAGDTYNYSPPINDIISKAKITGVCDLNIGKTFQSVTLQYEMKLPASLNDNRTGPSDEYVINKLITNVTLYHGKRLIYFKTKVDNVAKDQKLRVGFDLGAKCNVSHADTAFDIIERPTIRQKIWDMPKNKEAVMNQYPTNSTVIANQHQLVHRGLQEYEVDEIDGNDFALLTIIRSVGWLSRRDLRTRGNGAGPGFETPDAQCIGTYTFEYGLILGKKNMSLNQQKMLRQKILCQQSFKLKKEQKLFKQSSSVIAFSSTIQKEQNTFDIRMFNPTNGEQKTELCFGFEPVELLEVDFTGKILTNYNALQQMTFTFKPKEIKTIRVRRKSHCFTHRNEGVQL